MVSLKAVAVLVAMPLAAAQAQWTSTPNNPFNPGQGTTWRDNHGNTVEVTPNNPFNPSQGTTLRDNHGNTVTCTPNNPFNPSQGTTCR